MKVPTLDSREQKFLGTKVPVRKSTQFRRDDELKNVCSVYGLVNCLIT